MKSMREVEKRVRRSKDHIQHLEFPECVRHRVTMYLGSSGIEGLHHSFLEIIHNAIDEHSAGNCDKVNVTLHADGSVSVADNGKGIPHEKHSKAKVSQIELALTKLHAGSKFFQHGNKFSSGLNGVGASCVNAVSSWFKVRVKRGGKVYGQDYECGRPTAEVKRVKYKFPFNSGTLIHFKPDEEIFETTTFDVEVLVDMLDDLAFLNPGLTINFEVEESDEYEAASVRYHHENGLFDYLSWITHDRNKLHTRKPFVMKCGGEFTDRHGKKFKYLVRGVAVFVSEDVNDVRSFANNVRTVDGGTHEDGFMTGFGKAVRKYAADNNMIRGVKKFNPTDVTASGLCGVLSFYMHEPRFASQTKKKLTNAEAKDALEKLTFDSVTRFMQGNSSVAREMVKRGLENARKRERIEEIRTVKKVDNSGLAGKLSDCIIKVVEERELWLVEGDSAGGSAKMGRNAKYQAILPLKGKILNIEKASVRKIAHHDEIKAIIATIGTGVTVGDNFDLSTRNYDRIIIATDADCDGGHITVLLLTFFFRYMRPLIEAGHVYKALPPLYGVSAKRSKKIKYLQDAAALKKFFAMREKKGKSNDHLSIQRYKGLGEMNPSQLWETTLNPETRTLARITIPDAERASNLVSLLMSTDVESRRQFIEENALSASIDV